MASPACCLLLNYRAGSSTVVNGDDNNNDPTVGFTEWAPALRTLAVVAFDPTSDLLSFHTFAHHLL